jgi:D-hydroxyproline dehydrogenase subunit alpha
MNQNLHRRFDVLVVGGGPAGIAAACRAAEAGADVGIVDENVTLGGQIWRGSSSEKNHSPEASRWQERLQNVGVTKLCGKRVFHQPEAGVLLAEDNGGVLEFRYRNLILATGARERFLPFPGWTLPNVCGAGGLQALVKSGLPIRGKRVVVAGTGPLLLAVASYLRKHGAEIPIVCEQASRAKLLRLGIAMFSHSEKIAQSFRLAKDLAGVRYATNSWPLAAHGTKALEAVTISRAGKPVTLPCDYLACGFHLIPNVELPVLLGCRTQNGCVQVDHFQRTTVEGIFCAGEPTGVGGVELALVEGEIAGLSAAGRNAEAPTLFHKRGKFQRLARVLDATFSLRPELKSLPEADTLICRCEDVSYSRLRDQTSWRAAKLYTRCGMGPCQGRICGPATEFLFHWSPDSVRPPVFPARVEHLASAPAPESIPAVTGEMQ